MDKCKTRKFYTLCEHLVYFSGRPSLNTNNIQYGVIIAMEAHVGRVMDVQEGGCDISLSAPSG